MTKYWFTAALPLLALSLAGCPKSKMKKSSPPAIRKVKGDPFVFVEHTRMNGNAAISSEVLSDNAKFVLNTRGYIEALQSQSSFDEHKKAQDPGVMATKREERAQNSKDESFYGSVRGNSYVIRGRIDEDFVELEFSRDYASGGWKLKQLRSGNEVENLDGDIRLLHTSVAANNSAFSILLHNKSPESRYVIAFTFTRADRPQSPVQKVSRAYEYMFGTGRKVGWKNPGPVDLKVCETSNEAESHLRLPEEAMNEWQRALEDRLMVRTTRTRHCPPFSDLNSATFSYIHRWIEIEGENATLGMTSLLMDPNEQVIQDADVVILLEEIQEVLTIVNPSLKLSQNEVSNSKDLLKLLGSTALHEIGHLLGLHHQFNSSIPSIMGYDEGVYDLKAYDIQAIRELYN